MSVWAADAPPQVTVLDNGLTVASRERPSAETVTVAVAVRAGGRDEPPSLRGGSHLLEHLFFLGTERFPTEAALFGQVSAIGGDMNAQTSNETTTYFVTAPATGFAVAVDVLAEMMQRPTFPGEAVERERAVVQEELRGSRLSSVSLAIGTLGTRLLGSVAESVGGSVEQVADISIDELMRYRAERYVARNMVIAVSGPVRHADVVAAVSRAFGGMPAGGRSTPPPPAGGASGLRLNSETPLASVVMVGQRIPGLDSADAEALLVMDGILDGPGTRMADALQEAEVAFGGGTRIVQFSDTGLWAGFAFAPTNRAERVAEVVRAEVRRLQSDLVSEDELADATRYIAGRTRLNAETTVDQAFTLARGTLLGVYRTEEEQAERIRAVTAEDVRRVARTYLDPDSFSILAQR